MKVKKLHWMLLGVGICLFPFTMKSQKVSAEGLYGQVSATFAQLDEENAFVENLAYADMHVLPVGLKQTISNNEFTIAISDIRLLETHAELTVFARMRIPEKDQTLFFAGQNIKFSYTGSFIGDASLVLLQDMEIPINKNTTLILKGGFNTNSGRGSELTYVKIECLGFKELSVAGEVQLSPSTFEKINPDGSIAKEPVSAAFQLVAGSWSDWLIGLSFPSFQIKGLDGYIFDLENAVFDFSDLKNSSDIVFPSGYGRYLVGGAPELWRGIFVGNLSLTLPKAFSKKGERASIQATNLLIDENGVSGRFAGNNILPIEVGDASGWAFSVDDFILNLEAHRITEAGFGGYIGLPVSEKGTLLEYKAVFGTDNQYALTVALKDSLDFNFLSAKTVLKKNSFVSLEMADGKFRPSASLNGYMNISTSVTKDSVGNSNTRLNNVEFNELVLRTEYPYLKIGSLGYNGELQLFGFPLTISNIEVSCPGDKANLGFDLSLNLDEQFVNASTRLEISAVYKQNSGGRNYWSPHGVGLSAVRIKDCDIGGIMTLSGSLEILDNHPLYGSGFSGDIDLKFKKVVEGLSVYVATAFGRKDNSRYWFVDGLVGMPGVGIPIVTPLFLTGFGGGLSYGMKKTTEGGLGSSKTGCGYVPDPDMGLGLKAAVMFATESKSLAGDASFEISFNRHGGLEFVGFYGYAEFAANIPVIGDIQNKISSEFNKLVKLENDFIGNSKIEGMAGKLKDWKQFAPNEAAKVMTEAESKAQQANMAASLGIQYDVSGRTLHANFDFYMNIAGGVVRGVGSGNRAGQAVLHISPSKWYLHMGRPDDPIGLAVGVPGIATVTSKSYFMMGDDLPGSPPPPPLVAKILGVDMRALDYMRDLNSLQAGRGLAFGSSFSVKTGDLRFLILYANFEAGLGFDIMLRDYGNIQCKGRSGTIGINGWYANGQAYAYLAGELGVMVNLWFVKGKFPIISAGTAALIQAQLPNPLWLRANMAANFNLLGGLVKGNMRFKFSLGDKCELEYPGNSPVAMRMITDLKPVDRSQNLDVFASPQLALAMPVDKEFVVSEEDTRYYRMRLNEFAVYDGNQPIPGKVEWNRTQDVATFYSHDVLPPKKELKVKVRVGFEEKINGRWETVYTSGQLSEEKEEVSFTTGEAPDYIPVENILYSYPVVDQQYYLPDESSSGYITLIKGQPYLFGDNWNFKTQFFTDSGKAGEVGYSYDPGSKKITFQIPKITNKQNYQINFVAESKSSGSVEGGGSREENLLSADDSQVTRTVKEASDVVAATEGKSLLSYNFASSRYKTFDKKVEAYGRSSSTAFDIVQSMLLIMYQRKSGEEPFDPFELVADVRNGGIPLIDAVAVSENNYYKNTIYPLIYEGYPEKGHQRSAFGESLARALGLTARADYFPYVYELPERYFLDFCEIRSIVKDQRIMSHPLFDQTRGFPILEKGEYGISLQYYMPGRERKGTSSKLNYSKK